MTGYSLTPVPDSGDRWFPRSGAPTQARLLLFCLPHAGGGGTSFARWRDALPGFVGVQPVQLPGRESRLREPARIEPWEVARALLRRADRPYAIYGHSMGGVLAQEVVRRIAALGGPPPLCLCVGASRPPHLAPNVFERWADLADDALVSEVAALGGLPTTALGHPRLRARFVEVVRADVRWLATYRLAGQQPSAALTVPVVAFAGSRDRLAGAQVMRRWSELANAGFRLHVIDGGHFFHAENLPAFARVLARELGAALS
ncbi:thioesterase II family protein [Streptomyces iranensis]|uniref:Thioesterase n=1 Tax=Streptomyces iranensis TaxID=576784 RepID=A0A060ZSH7_9ACTN|nr:alpha/beta fold hydrolase [Streptomyces iranensis]MBP2060880.1 surfactin synthase thioesterase subunit [Streptomyces iranensis]CDR06341.1 Thioesterase [Streptomyces iranensis]